MGLGGFRWFRTGVLWPGSPRFPRRASRGGGRKKLFSAIKVFYLNETILARGVGFSGFLMYLYIICIAEYLVEFLRKSIKIDFVRTR